MTWSDLGWTLVTDVLSALVVLPVLTYVVLLALRVRPSRRIWGVRSTPWTPGAKVPPTLVISTSSFQPNTQYPRGRPQTGIGQVRVIAEISPSVATAYGAGIERHRLRMSDDCDLSDPIYHQDLVLVGGPKTNEVTRAALAAVPLPEGFGMTSVTTPEGVVTDRIEWAGEPRIPAEGEALGLVVRCGNPWGSGVLTVLAGVGTYGTEAAAVALVEEPVLRPTVRAALGRRRGFVALVRGETTQRRSGITRLVRLDVEGVAPMGWG